MGYVSFREGTVPFNKLRHFPVKSSERTLQIASQQKKKSHGDTVDGSEILLTTVGGGSLSHHLQGFSTIPSGWPWDFWLPSTVYIRIFSDTAGGIVHL